jgi:hypothetical protein
VEENWSLVRDKRLELALPRCSLWIASAETEVILERRVGLMTVVKMKRISIIKKEQGFCFVRNGVLPLLLFALLPCFMNEKKS